MAAITALCLTSLFLMVSRISALQTGSDSKTACESSNVTIDFIFNIGNDSFADRLWYKNSIIPANRIARVVGAGPLTVESQYSGRIALSGLGGIILYNVTKTDSGSYLFIILTDISSEIGTATTTVNVYVNPNASCMPRIEKNSADNFTCNISDACPGKYSIQAIWEDGSVGVFTCPSTTENTKYKCCAKGDPVTYCNSGGLCTDIECNGSDGPNTNGLTLSPSNTSYQLTELSPLIVNCLASCVPQCNCQWMGPGITQNDSRGLLSISQISRNQTGMFACIVNNPMIPGKSVTANFSVTVYYGPDAPLTLYPVTTSYRGIEGTFITNITCSADCNPPCNYQWIGPLGATSSGVLSLGTYDRIKRGSYFCMATNPRTSSSFNGSTIDMVVIYGPDIPYLSPSTTIYTKLEGDSVPDINCSADCFTGCTQVWMKGSSAVQESNGKTLSLRQVTREKAGDYTCCFNNTESRATGNISIKLIVQYKPIITTNAKYFDAEKGKTGHMHIEFYSGLFQPLITWYIVNNGTMELLQNSSHYRIYLSAVTVELKYYQKTIQLPGYNASLEVYDVNDEQFASYRVEINNSFAESVFATLQLKPRGPPETPANFNVVPDSITTHSLQLTWQAGFHGGASQTFFIQYREAGQINWLNKSEPSGFVLYVTLNSTITGLKDGTTYEFRIYSENVFNRSQISSTINETTKTGEPETPTKFHITDVQEKQVTFQWLSGDHREFDTMFVIKISMDYFTWANASLINAGKKEGWFSATVTGLKSNTVYYFRLYSFNVNGESDFADIDLATRTLKESVSSLDIGTSIGIGFGGFFLGVVGTISVIIVIWKRITATTKYNSTREADMSTNMQTYANIEVSSSPAPSHYEQLQQDHTEKTMYDCI